MLDAFFLDQNDEHVMDYHSNNRVGVRSFDGFVAGLHVAKSCKHWKENGHFSVAELGKVFLEQDECFLFGTCDWWSAEEFGFDVYLVCGLIDCHGYFVYGGSDSVGPLFFVDSPVGGFLF